MVPLWRCESCRWEAPYGEMLSCPQCGYEISLVFNCHEIREDRSSFRAWGKGESLWESFHLLLPPVPRQWQLSLGEGNTPLVSPRRLAKFLSLDHLYLKLESCNPTGSFKDRQFAIAYSQARAWGHNQYGIVTSGNAGVSLAAYCALGDSEAFIWVARATPYAKLVQMAAHGARIFLVPDPKVTGDMTSYYSMYIEMKDFCVKRNMSPMVTARRVNPLLSEGSKTIAFEIVDQLHGSPDAVFVPIGGGGLCGGIAKGFREIQALGLTSTTPAVFGAQHGADEYLPIDHIGGSRGATDGYYVPLDGAWALQSISASGGAFLGRLDDRIAEAQTLLAARAGVLAEPAGAVGFAGLLEARDRGIISAEDRIVCCITGHGLKDAYSLSDLANSEISSFPAVEVEDLQSSEGYLI